MVVEGWEVRSSEDSFDFTFFGANGSSVRVEIPPRIAVAVAASLDPDAQRYAHNAPPEVSRSLWHRLNRRSR